MAKVRAGRFPAFWKDQSPCFLSLSGSIEQGVSSTQSLPTFEKGNIKAWERPCDFYKVSQEFSGKVMVRISMFEYMEGGVFLVRKLFILLFSLVSSRQKGFKQVCLEIPVLLRIAVGIK